MQIRKASLVNGHYYHIYTRSIAKYQIFNSDDDYLRIKNILDLYRFTDFNYKYSRFLTLEVGTQNKMIVDLRKTSPVMISVVAYCLMPTHIHLILRQIAGNGISKYMSKVLNGYSRYFNTHYHRTGPLWSGRFKSVLINSDEQLLHLSRYIHLNPTSSKLVENPKDWAYSSYLEYLKPNDNDISSTKGLFDITPIEYKKFVNERTKYQQELSLIKNFLIDDYAG